MLSAETLNMDYNSALLSAMLQSRKTAIVYKAALYLRLSRDDNNGSAESMSIQSQRDMLLSYAKDNGYEVVGIYSDDGFTGTNYDRPDFKRMINDIRLGKINMVITKDLSRLGRNYVMTGQYTENFFPDHNVRFIAINDNVDTSNEDNDIAPFKNILNEMYAKDISKKVRSMRKVAAKQGKFMGSITSYGYKRSAINKHKLEIDEYAAKIVRRIFELFKNRESARQIADKLNRENVLSPQHYYYETSGRENPFSKNSKTWSSATVISILKKEVYIGQMVQGKVTGKSFKSKKRLELPPDMWAIVENTHEAIIDIDTWNAVQFLLVSNRNSKPRKTEDGEVSLFANVLKCSDCNARLTLTTKKIKSGNGISSFYRCSRQLQHGEAACTPHRIRLETLASVVLADIQNNAKLANEDKEAFAERLHNVSVSENTAEIEQYRKREAQIQKRLTEIDGLMQKTFEKNCAGLLPDSVMANLMSSYEKEKSKLEDDIAALRIEKLKAESQTADLSKELAKLRSYADINELNRAIVTSLIKSIHISEPTMVNGEKQYAIEIRYKFQNALETKKETPL
ncbi:MAG: recombinase family protein [Defluviitaleaceae bacterium]|nr:recombinase family protein [Defluviitaleaceae bacterium]